MLAQKRRDRAGVGGGWPNPTLKLSFPGFRGGRHGGRAGRAPGAANVLQIASEYFFIINWIVSERF